MKKIIQLILLFLISAFSSYAQDTIPAIKKSISAPVMAPAAIKDPPCDDCPLGYDWNRDLDNDGYGDPNFHVYSWTKPSGYVANQADCNDRDSTINPDTVWYRDADGDGFGTSALTIKQCLQPAGYVRNALDLNDSTPYITNIAPQYFYLDADGDGYGNPNVYVYYSFQPGGYVTNNWDCYDSDSSLNPNTVWYRDADGDGYGNGGVAVNSCTQPGGYVRNAADYDDSTGNITNVAPRYFYRDADADGYGNPNVYVYYSYQPGGYVANNWDCYDSDASLNPNTVWYRDADGDGYGNANLTVQSCAQPVGYVRNAADYDDSTGNITNVAPRYFYRDADADGYGNPNVYVYYSFQPGGYVANNLDCNDSDGSLNPNTVWYRDADGDGFGNANLTVQSCTQPGGYVRNAADYDDSTGNITNVAPQYFYRDADGDGYGNPNVYVYYSYQPGGYVANNGDCYDSDSSLNPNTVWYRDADGDGFGNANLTVQSCSQPGGYVRNAADYDDSTGNITNVAPQYFYYDSDGDGYGNPNVYVYYSYQPGGYVTNNSDCNDSDASLNPITVWYRDADGDTFGTSALTVKQCLKPEGYVRNAADIDDSTANITNIQPQYFYRDADGDGYGNSNVYVIYSYQPGGYVTNNWDCNDSDASLNPYTKWYADNDLDGLGDPSVFVQQCTAPNGNYVRNNSDNCPSVAGSSSDCSDILIPSADRNYIISKVYKKPKKAIVESPALDEVQTNITYFDGLGRAVQQIANRQSSAGKDIITHITYDSFGRQVQEFLPYEASSTDMSYATGAKDATNAFYNTEKYENTSNPFSQKELESSPLSRILRQAAPGNPWAMDSGHEIKFDYGANAADEVKLYKASATWNAGSGLYDISLSDAGYYEPKELFKNITYDENTSASLVERSGSTIEFKNKEGQVVLKRTYDAGEKHDTYYVYDIYGNLTYVIPPKVEGSINPDILNGLCYQYKYDNKNRLAEKKLPGKQWEFIVYDKLDRAVATGPAFSPFKDENTEGWIITKYDAFGRPIYTGWSNQASNTATRKSLQDAQKNATVIFESRQTSGSIDGIEAHYSNTIEPVNFKLLTVNYYDGYAFPNAQPLPTSIEGLPVLSNVKTLNTGSWTRALTTASSTAGETSTIFYDDKARPIKNHLQNHLGGYTSTESKIDFTGKTLYTITKHKRTSGDAEIIVREEFTYSAQDRLLTHTHQINGGTAELLADNSYDALGQLENKKVGWNSGNPIQKIDYQYNIRGWLKEINKISNLQQGTDPLDFFAFKINYNTIQTDLEGVLPLYNGNISQTFWKSMDQNERGYSYKYDNLNRLKNAIYEKNGLVTSAYDENLTYDKNGNIKTLSRKGDYDEQVGSIVIDDLVYTYANNSNQLTKVDDNSNNSSGFSDSNKTDEDYGYDENGNVIRDKNKNITDIFYNHLNLPKKITFGGIISIEYIYNAAGQKLSKILDGRTTTDYLTGYQYYNNSLLFFPMSEGYVNNSQGTFSYIFQFKDHLGNARLSYIGFPLVSKAYITEINNYYPFGLQHKGYNSYPNAWSWPIKYKYNGKEFQDEGDINVYDYGARNYDPALGRWMNIDPLAETSRRYSPYTYALDNPVFFIDPDGMAAIGNDDIITKVSNKKGDSHHVQRNVQMSMTLTIVNSKGVNLSKTMFNKSSGSVKLNSMSGIAEKNYKGNDISTSDNVSVSVNYKVVNSLKDVGKNDHVMMLVDNIPKGDQKVDPIGLADRGGRVSAVEVGTIGNNTFDNTANHEIGHLLGLEHKSGGLMNPIVNGSTSTSPGEKGTIVNGQIGPFEGNGTYKESERSSNYSAGIISQVNDFLYINKIK